MPDVFVQFCQWFHQDVFILYASWDDAISAFLAQLDHASKVVLQTYLTEVIASGATDEELEKRWQDQGAQFGLVEPSAIRGLFTETQRAIAAALAR